MVKRGGEKRGAGAYRGRATGKRGACCVGHAAGCRAQRQWRLGTAWGRLAGRQAGPGRRARPPAQCVTLSSPTLPRSRPRRANGLAACLPVALLHGFGYMLGYLLPRVLGFSERVSRTVSIETGGWAMGLAPCAFCPRCSCAPASAASVGPVAWKRRRSGLAGAVVKNPQGATHCAVLCCAALPSALQACSRPPWGESPRQQPSLRPSAACMHSAYLQPACSSRPA